MADKSLWRTLLQSALETEEHEINCEECFDVLDMYADLIIEGTEPADLMPTVKQHLNQCNCCAGELEAMLVMIQEAAAKNKPPSTSNTE